MNMVALPHVTGLDVEEAKQALRSAARAHRARRSAHEREELGKRWVDTALDFVGDSKLVAAYVSVNDEPPTAPLCDALVASGHGLILPKLGPKLAREWAWYEGADDLKVMAPGRPPEPSGPAVGPEILAQVDVLIIPALLVNHQGRRIGQGGGWYDRVLKQVTPPTRVGAMVFADEYVSAEFPQDDMDRPVPCVILPDRWGPCNGPIS